MNHRFVTLDVFTSARFGGNPLAVVLEAGGIAPERMQHIACEFNLSETTFVSAPKDPANTAAVRIFTPAAELPFAGHPVIGTAVARAGVVPGRWEAAKEGNDVIGAFVYARGGSDVGAAFHARMFAPDYGVPEDPATGAAAAAFPGQVAASEDLSDGGRTWLIEQGHEMGRPSQINVEAELAGGGVAAVRVGGYAVTVSEGAIRS